jgi:hypothetical protein
MDKGVEPVDKQIADIIRIVGSPDEYTLGKIRKRQQGERGA